MAQRWQAQDLIDFTRDLFRVEGLDEDKAQRTAELLVEADLMGHTTHGLALAPGYLREVREGRLARTGEPEIISDLAAVATWDGNYLPGLWLTARAVDEAVSRAEKFGIGAISIRRSGHIGCLAAFLRRATDRGMMLLVTCSDPSVATVAPFGGRKALFTPNPIAIGFPTDGDPVLVDISASVTTNAFSNRLAAEGKTWPHQWWLDAEGNPTTDGRVITTTPPGTILPAGGLDHGHKGYGLALVIEALSQGLSGFGRRDAPTTWGAATLVQAWNPAAFGGLDEFTAQTGWLAEACRANPPRPGADPVRVPGDSAARKRREQLERGVALYAGIMDVLGGEARRLGVTLPTALAS